MRPKGMACKEKFYFRVIRDLSEAFIMDGIRPSVSQWDEGSYYATSDRQSFYLMPKAYYCLSETFIKDAGELFGTDISYVSERYPGARFNAGFTGRRIDAGVGRPNVVLEVSCRGRLFYVPEKSLRLFPKNISVSVLDAERTPVFVSTPLSGLLGGAMPLKDPPFTSVFIN